MDQNTKTLPMLAAELRALRGREATVDSEWVEVKLATIATLAEARDRFPSDNAFGAWLVENDLTWLGRNDRGAAINMAQDMGLARIVLEEGRSKSFVVLWLDHMRPRMQTVAELGRCHIDVIPASVKSDPAEMPESTPQEPIPALSPPVNATKTRRAVKQPTLLEKDHGAYGRDVQAWLLRGTLRPDGGTQPSFSFAALPKKTIKLLAEFVRDHADILPPARSQTTYLSLKTFWQEAPTVLHKQTLGSTDDRTILNVIEAWDMVIAPVLAQWRAAGSPKKSDDWYIRSRTPPVVAAARPAVTLQQPADFYAVQRARLAETTAPMKALGQLAPDGHDQWPLPAPEPIRVNGLDIWPTTDARYDWAAAYYAFSLFRSITCLLKEDRPHVQARIVMNPIGPLLCHINGRVGAVWGKIAAQVYNYPEQADDTFGPGKTLQAQS